MCFVSKTHPEHSVVEVAHLLTLVTFKCLSRCLPAPYTLLWGCHPSGDFYCQPNTNDFQIRIISLSGLHSISWLLCGDCHAGCSREHTRSLTCRLSLSQRQRMRAEGVQESMTRRWSLPESKRERRKGSGGAGEMAQWSRTLAAFTETNWFVSRHPRWAPHNHL